jgi:hypothetical protein
VRFWKPFASVGWMQVGSPLHAPGRMPFVK